MDRVISSIDRPQTDRKRERKGRERELTKMVTQGKAGRRAADFVVTTWRMDAINLPI